MNSTTKTAQVRLARSSPAYCRVTFDNPKVHGRCFKRHTHVEFIAFLESLAKRYPRLELHLICDNYGTHKHPRSRAGSPPTRASICTSLRPVPRG